MKKTTVKTKLVLRKETTRALLERELAQAGAGQDEKISIGLTTCIAGTPDPK